MGASQSTDQRLHQSQAKLAKIKEELESLERQAKTVTQTQGDVKTNIQTTTEDIAKQMRKKALERDSLKTIVEKLQALKKEEDKKLKSESAIQRRIADLKLDQSTQEAATDTGTATNTNKTDTNSAAFGKSSKKPSKKINKRYYKNHLIYSDKNNKRFIYKTKNGKRKKQYLPVGARTTNKKC